MNYFSATKQSPGGLSATSWFRTSLFVLAISLPAISSCQADQTDKTYSKDGLTFSYLPGWTVDEDVMFPGARRSLVIDSPTKSLVSIEMYAKKALAAHPEYREYNASLKSFAVRYKNRGIYAKLQTRDPEKQVFIKREGKSGLKETQRVKFGDMVDAIMTREFYRFDTKDEVIFVTMDTTKDEYKAAAAGLDRFLRSFKYQ